MMTSSDESDTLIFEDDNSFEENMNKIREIKRSTPSRPPSRWFMLFLVSAIALVNGIQNLQFAGCEEQVIAFFKVSYLLGDLLTQAYYISFIVLAFPVIYIIMTKGLKFTVISAAVLSFLGAALSTVSTTNFNFFPIALTSEFTAGFAQVFVLCLPSLLAGVWFPVNEASTASGTVVFFYEVGNGLALLVPPLLVKQENFDSTLGASAVAMFGVLAAFSFVIYLLIQFCFAENPKSISTSPPGSSSYCSSLKNLLSNPNFLLLFFSYGIDFGIFSAVTSIFKSVIADNFPEASDATTGQVIAFMILAGTPAPLVFGPILDKTKEFIRILYCIHGICITSTALMIFAMKAQIFWLVWVAAGILGFGFTGKMSVGLDTAAEMTYPEPEGTSSGLLMWSMSIFTTVFIQVIRFLLQHSNFYVNVFICTCSVIAFIFTCFMKKDLRRSRAHYEIIEDSEGRQ